jgi:hypothetical protein
MTARRPLVHRDLNDRSRFTHVTISIHAMRPCTLAGSQVGGGNLQILYRVVDVAARSVFDIFREQEFLAGEFTDEQFIHAVRAGYVTARDEFIRLLDFLLNSLRVFDRGT